MNFLRKLCSPAYVYLVINVIFLIMASIQNFGNVNTYCLGQYSCDIENTTLLFLMKILYVAFWTWILNLMCKEGSLGRNIAWVLVLIPLVIMFLILGMLLLR